MIKLIDTRLVAKLMRETAKECGMTRVYSSTDNIWWAKAKELSKNEKVWEFDAFDSYRRIVKAYDFVADNFLELLEAKVKAEGFELADCGIKLSKCRATYSNYKDVDYREAYRKHWDYRDKILNKIVKERNIKDAPDNWRDTKEGEELEMLSRRTVREANRIADKKMPMIKPPVLPTKIHGSTYVRMLASFIGPRQYKTYG